MGNLYDDYSILGFSVLSEYNKGNTTKLVCVFGNKQQIFLHFIKCNGQNLRSERFFTIKMPSYDDEHGVL